MTEPQLKALKVTIMAERRLRTHFRGTPAEPSSLAASYAWALEEVR